MLRACCVQPVQESCLGTSIRDRGRAIRPLPMSFLAGLCFSPAGGCAPSVMDKVVFDRIRDLVSEAADTQRVTSTQRLASQQQHQSQRQHQTIALPTPPQERGDEVFDGLNKKESQSVWQAVRRMGVEAQQLADGLVGRKVFGEQGRAIRARRREAAAEAVRRQKPCMRSNGESAGGSSTATGSPNARRKADYHSPRRTTLPAGGGRFT